MILGVESSCDESALALFDAKQGLRGEWVHSQIDLHCEYGGVVPDLASREHLTNFGLMLERMPRDLLDEITAVAVTRGPGLAGCLAMGVSLAKAAALALDVPVYGVNHLRGHAWSPFLNVFEKTSGEFGERLEGLLPHLGLIVSGGNTLLFTLDAGRGLRIVGQTLDDAAGEALDKGAKLLGLPYPGGPQVERLARQGNARAYDFPRAKPKNRTGERGSVFFSFSGLKTSMRYRLEAMEDAEIESSLPDLCAGYQAAVVDQLCARTAECLSGGHFRSLGLSGGVANNRALRDSLEEIARCQGVPLLTARTQHTGDNAAMIAFAAWLERDKLPAGDGLAIEPALRLDAW